MTIWVINYIDWKSDRKNSWRSSTSRDTQDYVLSVEPVGLIKSIFPSATVPARTLIWSERKCPFSHHLNTYFSNSVFQKSLNGFVAGPWWKQWLLTFFCLLPSLHPSSPSVHLSRLISLSKWFLTPSISLQPIQAPALACGRCYALWQVKWKPREISSSYKRSKAYSQSKKEAFFLFFLSCQQTGEKAWAVIWRLFGFIL